MYLNYFGLKERPFTLSPDPKYLYLSASHKEALSQMLYTVSNNCGLMLLSGEVGTGKTSLVNDFIRRLPKSYKVILLSHGIFSPLGLLQNIGKELGISYQNSSLDELMMKLYDVLKGRHHLGKKTVLILDEAQVLQENVLQHLRLLTNFETYDEKFLQIFLIGQPEIKLKLRANSLRALDNRIYLRFHLNTFNFYETKKYIYYRLAIAKNSATNKKQHTLNKLFCDKTVRVIYDFSKGIPRLINVYSDKALVSGYANNENYHI